MTAIEQATGTGPAGYNNYWIRPGMNTREIMQELGFACHIDDLSADEPFLQSINGQPFATGPYMVDLNDIASLSFPDFNPAGYEQQLTGEFGQLYAEGRHSAPGDGRRPARAHLRPRLRVRTLDRIFIRLRGHDAVWWTRKDQIARRVLDHPGAAAWVDRELAPVSGLQGRSA
jgi:hypothetical protein